MHRLGIFIADRARAVLVIFIGLIAISGYFGFQSFGSLSGGGYDNPDGDSTRVSEILREEFDLDPAEAIVLLEFSTDADQPENQQLAAELADELGEIDGVVGVKTYYTLGSPPGLKSEDGKLVYVLVDLDNDTDNSAAVDVLVDEISGPYQDATVYVAGIDAVTKTLNEAIYTDIIRAELIAVPLAVLLLLFVFGSLVAAGLPLMVGGLAIVGAFFFVWLASQFTEMSVFSLNLITGLGLGLGIDYSLLVVNRFREERANGLSSYEATIKTVETAGRTVFFSGLTVAVTLLSLGFFPQFFLQSFAISGFAVVMLAVAGAVIALPASLRLLGDGINKLRIIRRDLTPRPYGLLYKLARFTARKAVAVLVISIAGLGALFSLSSEAQFGQVDDRILPKDSAVVVASDKIRDRFTGRENDPIEIVVAGAQSEQLEQYLLDLESLDGITRVQSSIGLVQDGQLNEAVAPLFAEYSNPDYERVVAISNVEPRSPEGYDLVVEIRSLDNSFDEVLVGGGAAFYTDSQQGIESNIPLVLLWIFATTALLLFLFTGSVVLPMKAILLTVLSLGATLGFITWVFDGGELMWLIGDFQVTGSLDTSSLVLVGVVAFGLSMDYELFLLSRIKEEHEAGKPTSEAVAIGLQRSGRIITAAALILAVTFGAFASSGVSIMKMLGLGIAFAILLDATVVRALLVPSIMRLLGKWNWYAPRPLRKFYRKLGIEH